MSNTLIFINKDATNVKELLMDTDWTLKEIFANVYDIIAHESPIGWIVKVYRSQDNARTEIKALNKLKHIDGIPAILATGLSKSLSYIIIKRIHGLDLYEYVSKFGLLKEKQVRIVALKLLRILKNVHEGGIVHKDIKPENIMFDRDTKRITLIDFEGRETALYNSPEIINGAECTTKSDMWAVGITCYMLVYGDVPFRTRDHILNRHLNPPKYWSCEFVDFLECLLDKDPKNRWSATDALNHPWLLD